MKTVLVCGAGGFIGSHLVKKLKARGYLVVGVDIINPEFSYSKADYFYQFDLRKNESWKLIFEFRPEISEIYQLAADMGGAGYVFTGEHDADIMFNSVLINLHCIKYSVKYKCKVFYSSSACIYPKHNQVNSSNPNCSEDSAYPAEPDSEYGWEKLFSERLYLAYNKNYGLDIRIARFHNIFGPEGAWNNGKEKAPAAICRKIAMTENNGTIEIWGNGEQTRSFLYIDECLLGIEKLMQHNFIGPVNIGSDEMVSINELVSMVSMIALKNINIKHIPGPEGVRGRNSDNKLILEKLSWKPSASLYSGLEKTYEWVYSQIQK